MPDTRVDRATERLDPCRACPVACGAHRLAGERGDCGAGPLIPVASAFPHFGEENPISGRAGSGTIFLAGCNLHCLYCQNSDISRRQVAAREELTAGQLAELMLALAAQGVHNVNLVSPTHVGPQLVEAICMARAGGLSLPIVWNTGGYESPALLRLLDGLVDIYLPDAKYWDPDVAQRLSGVADYPAVLRAALREMHRQVGELEIEDGVARRGLLVRHLVLPEGLAGSEGILTFLAEELSRRTYVNIMDQYYPSHRAAEAPALGRAASPAEVAEAVAIARRVGLTRLDGRPGPER